MRRLIYCYVSNGAADPDNVPQWNPITKSHDPFASHWNEEGFCYLFRRLLEEKILDQVLVVIESNRSPGYGTIDPPCEGMSMLVVPHINQLDVFTKPGDVLWARGGWRSWYEYLKNWHDTGNWLLFYRAASNRGAWTFWDIVFDDLIKKPDLDEHNRFYYPINKPINPNVFFNTGEKQIYDLCLGASHVSDKKGQWRMVEALVEYKKMYGKNLKCILPGGFSKGEMTNTIFPNIEKHKLDVNVVGMTTRKSMNVIYNQSKLFLHGGGAGQNDRGPLEAMSVGCPVMITRPEIHAPFITKVPYNFSLSTDPNEMARQIHFALQVVTHELWRANVRLNYHLHNDIEKVIIPQFKKVFDLVFRTEYKDRKILSSQLS